MTTMKRTLAFVSALLAVGALTAVPSNAATPTASVIGSGTPTVTWSGTTALPVGGAYCISSDDPVCDNFFLEVTTTGYVTVTISPKVTGDDWDLFVFDDDGQTVGTSQHMGGGSETSCFPVEARGRWEVDAAPFLVSLRAGYRGVATWSSTPVAPCAA
ncbi:MAG TPA: hypothetical protein VMY34_09125 [Acidimicrobiales bacterium]|nr:hypothetical protein [Acidimicrobiales bacterium]